MSEKQTWYRPERYGKELLEELCVIGETKEFITVESTTKDWQGKERIYTRRQAKNGATRSKREALVAMLVAANNEKQRARDTVSVLIQKCQNIEQALAKEPE